MTHKDRVGDIQLAYNSLQENLYYLDIISDCFLVLAVRAYC